MSRGDFIRSANPGDPEWEVARGKLVERLNEVGFRATAGQVERGEATEIQSWIALELLATADPAFASPVAGGEVERLREALERISRLRRGGGVGVENAKDIARAALASQGDRT